MKVVVSFSHRTLAVLNLVPSREVSMTCTRGGARASMSVGFARCLADVWEADYSDGNVAPEDRACVLNAIAYLRDETEKVRNVERAREDAAVARRPRPGRMAFTNGYAHEI